MFDAERRSSEDITFHEDEVKLARHMMDQLRTTVEFLYYLMDHRKKHSFTLILLSADDLRLDTLLYKWKRQTDILIDIDIENNVYVIICQTRYNAGGKKFAEILMSHINMHDSSNAYCVVTEFNNTKYSIQEMIFNVVEKYIYIKQEKKSKEVFFTEFRGGGDDALDFNYHS